MHIRDVHVKNFRLLEDVSFALAETTTVIVGRNNSGKTSFGEVFRRLVRDGSKKPRFEDFSSNSFAGFCEAYYAHSAKKSVEEVRGLIPAIELRITFEYPVDLEAYGPLANIIVDLDPSQETALVVIAYELGSGQIDKLFEGFEPKQEIVGDERAAFFSAMSERVPSLFERRIWAEDPNDATNRRSLESRELDELLATEFVSAQRGLDDVTDRETNVLAKALDLLFSAAADDESSDKHAIVTELTAAVEDVRVGLSKQVGDKLNALIPQFERFGYPGLADSQLSTELELKVGELLKDSLKVKYADYEGVPLPESYNGLGSRNLIYILLQLLVFYREFVTRGSQPGVQVVFLEEPEAHLHPQMQEVFVRKLEEFVALIPEIDDSDRPWPVQFVITSHSPHIANEARFTSIRYFLATAAGDAGAITRSTAVKDLSSHTHAIDEEFLHKYLTLTKADLFFADKATLIEGAAERILVARMIELFDAEDVKRPKLASQFVSHIEVGGAYAHKFIPLMEFLELPTLIITDIDSVDGESKACLVSAGESSSNACINAWFGGDKRSPAALIAAPSAERSKERLYLTYQVPEEPDGPCGRTLEDAFILANRDEFTLEGSSVAELEESARAIAAGTGKTEFALRFAVEVESWKVPKYIADGMNWLALSESATSPLEDLQDATPEGVEIIQ